MTAQELRQKYLDFFKSKGHTVIPSASLVPENDPTTLFTGSGMQPMVPYLLGEKHPMGQRIVDSQKCFRTQDIEEVGDNRHTTVFEMLGNWSLGDYFKKEQVGWMFEFLTKEIGLNPLQIFITVFRGNEALGIPRDTEAVEYWQNEFTKINIEAKDIDFAEINGLQDGRIFYYDESKNWWSRAGVPNNMPIGEPGGPDSEMFWDFGADLKIHEASEFKDQPCHVNCDCGRFLEIGNNVFMQYIKTNQGYELLPKGNIDFGGGLERIAAAKNNTPDIFMTDLFMPIIKEIEQISGKKYDESSESKRSFRVIADHLKASTFLICDGVVPSNTAQGYFLRRLIRRAVRYGKLVNITQDFTLQIAEIVIKMYGDFFPELVNKKAFILAELKKEEDKFRTTLEHGLKEAEKLFNFYLRDEVIDIALKESTDQDLLVSGADAFNLFQTYGFPIEMVEELASEKGLRIDHPSFLEEQTKHQDLSRTASAGMFKGGLADASEETMRLHTAAHLMLAALRQVLGEHVSQKGSNITAERLRFDFAHTEKMTPEQILAVENIVNDAIKQDLPVTCTEMSLEEAKQLGAMGAFESKYGERVKVYTAGSGTNIVSREICGGPHVDHTGQLSHFKIQKEESSSSGVRRIKAILE